MPGNPLIDQGVLSRIRASVTWANFSQLNVTSPFLDKEGITMRLEGEAATQHPTLTGLVQSPEPYMAVSIVIALLRTQALAEAYKTQMQASVLLGAGTIYPDVSTGLTPFSVLNASIQSIGELLLNGTTPIFGVTCRAYWIVNNSLFN